MNDVKNASSNRADEVEGRKPAEKAATRPGYLRKADAARYLGISIRTLTLWMRQRVVAYMKMSHKVCLFRQFDLDAAMDRFRLKAVGE